MIGKIIFLVLTLFSMLFFLSSSFSQDKPPEIQNDYATAMAEDTVKVNVLKNDIAEEGDTIIISYASAQMGDVMKQDSMLIYVSEFSAYGIDTVSYVIYDINNGLYSEEGYLIITLINNTFDFLDISNIKARINGWGNHFWGFTDTDPVFYVPKNTIKTCMFNIAFLIGGLDDNNELHFAGERYRQIGIDFDMGPVSATYDTNYNKKWKKAWKLNKAEIDYHRQNWMSPGYEPIENISTWPGNGNPDLGQLDKIAPFHDYDGDDVYDPLKGDYPVIRGDQAIFFVFNDDRNPNTESKGRRVGVEVHGMAYAFDCQQDSALHNSIFLHYDIINRSDTTYSNTYIGLYADVDIGFPWDDHIKSDVIHNSLIGYNGDNFDGDNGPEANYYNDHPPAQTVTILGGPYLDPDGEDNPEFDEFGNPLCDFSYNGIQFNDGIIDNERFGMTNFLSWYNWNTPMGDPQVASEYYNFLRSVWKDGVHLQYGGRGHPDYNSVGPDCGIMYPGDSDTLNWGLSCMTPNPPYNDPDYLWLEETEGHDPSDRRGVLSSGPFTFHPGDRQVLDIAFVFARNYADTGNHAAFEILEQRLDKLFTYFLNDSTPCNGGSFSEVGDYRNIREIKIYPNPAKDYIQIDGIQKKGSHSYFIYDMTGRVLRTGVVKNDPALINLDNIDRGMYILVVKTEDQYFYSRFIISGGY